MFAPVKIWQLHVRTTTECMQSRQFHSQSCQWPISIFACELRKYSKTWRLSPDEFPAIIGHWDFNVNGTPPSENSGTFWIGNEESHYILYKMYLLAFLNITRNIVNVWKSNLSEYLLGRFVQEHRNFCFTGIWDISAEWGNLFCTVKTTCRKDAGSSAAHWGMPIFPHLSCMIFPQLKVFQKWFNSAEVFMLQVFFFKLLFIYLFSCMCK